MNVAGRNVSIGALVAAVGGVLAIVGAFLVWFQVSLGTALGGPKTDEIKGLDNNASKLALVLGIVVLALVLAWVLQLKIPYLPAIVGVAGVLLLVVLGLAFFTDILSVHFAENAKIQSVKDALADFNKALDAAKAQGADVSGSSASIGIGYILEIAAGIVVIVGGALGFRKKSA